MLEKLTIHDMDPKNKPRERLLEYGADSLSDAELLAIILRSGSKNASALQLSNKILGRFGGLEGLTKCDLVELFKISGIGTAKATSIKAFCEVSIRLNKAVNLSKITVNSPKDVHSIIKKDLYGKRKETLYVISLDVRGGVIGKDLISVGTVNETLVHVREVFRQAIVNSAVSIIMVHNHPSNDPKPSEADIEVTKKIATAGDLLGISLIDHVIVTDTKFVSVKSDGF